MSLLSFSDFHSIYSNVMQNNGLSRFCTEEHAKKFHELCEHMLQVNQSMNLTAIKEPRAVILLHFADSLTIEPFLPHGASLIDVGCGAGFPSLPLAICRPDLKILSLDSTEKRIRYVEQTAKMLGCDNLRATAARAEEAANAPALREKFDVCTARAVAALPVLSELCLPFVKKGGHFLAMKAKRAGEEWESAKAAVKKLGGTLKATHEIILKDEEEQDTRTVFEIQKTGATPKEYPRRYAQILKKPL